MLKKGEDNISELKNYPRIVKSIFPYIENSTACRNNGFD